MAPSPAEASAPAVSRHPLRNRIVSAIVLAPLALALVWVPGPLVQALFHAWLALAAVWLAREWGRLTARRRPGGAGLLLMLATAGAVVATAAGIAAWQTGLGLALAGGLVYGLARIEGVEAPGWLAAGAVALGVPCLAFAWLRDRPVDGRAVLVWLLVVVWATDIGAYAVGRWLGGPRLAPRISPNKTWAGLVGGMLCAAIVGGAAGWSLGRPAGALALAGGVLAAVAQAGDLAELAAKRRFGVKDAGSLIPGHGGLLDRVDGLLTTTPLVALLVWAKGGSVLAWA